MPISQDILQKIGDLQNQVWQSASQKATDAAGFDIKFADPLTIAVAAQDIFAEATSPRLVVQFALANLPEDPTMVLVPQEVYGHLVAAVRGEQPESIDETLVSEIQPILEAIVQGLCIAIGNLRNEPIVASELSSKFQIPNYPKNFQRSEHLVRVNVGMSFEDFTGTLTWLMDAETVYSLTGVDPEEPGRSVFSQLGSATGSGIGGELTPLDESGLGIIMDIPLEVSVELGRVKMQVRDVVELGAGSIVEIDKAAGEPVDVMVNGRLVARGEVVVIDDNFGVRITEILSIQERLQKLNEAA